MLPIRWTYHPRPPPGLATFAWLLRGRILTAASASVFGSSGCVVAVNLQEGVVDGVVDDRRAALRGRWLGSITVLPPHLDPLLGDIHFKHVRQPARQRTSIMVAGVLQMLLAAALLDLRRRPGEQVRGSKKLWAAATFVNFVGPLAYFAFGRRPTQPDESIS